MKRTFLIVILAAFAAALVFPVSVPAKNTTQESKNMGVTRVLINEGYNRGNIELVTRMISPDCTFYLNGVENPVKGPDALRQDITQLAETYQDYAITIEDIFAKLSKVTVRWSFTGTHKQSGKTVDDNGVAIGQWSGGKMVKSWQTLDTWTEYQQLGYTLTPPPASPAK